MEDWVYGQILYFFTYELKDGTELQLARVNVYRPQPRDPITGESVVKTTDVYTKVQYITIDSIGDPVMLVKNRDVSSSFFALSCVPDSLEDIERKNSRGRNRNRSRVRR